MLITFSIVGGRLKVNDMLISRTDPFICERLALVVDGSGSGYLKTVCDYARLDPTRARLLAPDQALRQYAWSSWPE
jgi:flagellar motor component MotA